VQEEAEQHAGEQELTGSGEAAGAVPAGDAVAREELPAARPREAEDVLQVRERGGERPGHGRVERPADGGEQEHAGNARADLEAPVGDVLVREPVAGQV
jgi:hypothetical protein